MSETLGNDKEVRIEGMWPGFTLDHYNGIKQALFVNAQEIVDVNIAHVMDAFSSIENSELSEQDRNNAKREYLSEVMLGVAMSVIEPVDSLGAALSSPRGLTSVYEKPESVVGLSEPNEEAME